MRDGLKLTLDIMTASQKKELEDLATEFSSQGAELGVDKQRNKSSWYAKHTGAQTLGSPLHPGHWRDRQEETALQTPVSP
jgi:hypothetical protein